MKLLLMLIIYIIMFLLPILYMFLLKIGWKSITPIALSDYTQQQYIKLLLLICSRYQTVYIYTYICV